MLNKSVVLSIRKLIPNNINDAFNLKALLNEILENNISACLVKTSYEHLDIYFNFDNYNNYTNIDETDFFNLLNEEQISEVRQVNSFVKEFVLNVIEEFNIYDKSNKNNILNFSVNLINLSNVVVTSDILSQGVKKWK